MKVNVEKVSKFIICLLMFTVFVHVISDDVVAINSNIALDMALSNTNVTLKKSSDNLIKASYDSKYFDVKIDQTSDQNFWSVEVNLIRKSARNRTVTIYLPDIQYKSINFDFNNSAITGGVLTGEVTANLYNSMLDSTLLKSFKGNVTIYADDSLVRLGSKNNYKNFDVSVTGDKNSVAEVPRYFSSDFWNCRYFYRDGAGDYKINIEMKNSVTELY